MRFTWGSLWECLKGMCIGFLYFYQFLKYGISLHSFLGLRVIGHSFEEGMVKALSFLTGWLSYTGEWCQEIRKGRQIHSLHVFRSQCLFSQGLSSSPQCSDKPDLLRNFCPVILFFFAWLSFPKQPLNVSSSYHEKQQENRLQYTEYLLASLAKHICPFWLYGLGIYVNQPTVHLWFYKYLNAYMEA